LQKKKLKKKMKKNLKGGEDSDDREEIKNGSGVHEIEQKTEHKGNNK
jgi:hypothetical protein